MRPKPLTPDDATAYTALRREMVLDTPCAFLGAPGDDECAKPDWVAAQLAKDENDIIAVAHPDDPNTLLAAAGVFRSPRAKTRHRAYVWGVYCTPAHRRTGIARAVMLAAIDTARSWNGVASVSLSVSASCPGAIALYTSLGFQHWGTEPDAVRIDGVSHDELFMRLGL